MKPVPDAYDNETILPDRKVIIHMEVIKAMVFGVVEGITEWLPVSSTGHMILLDEFVRLDVSDRFYSMFQVMIQLGAILSVIVLYWKDFFPVAVSVSRHGALQFFAIREEKFLLWGKIFIACVPAAVVGVLFHEKFESMFYNYRTVAAMLIIFGAAFLAIENQNRGKKPKALTVTDITWSMALIIGVFQLIAAVFPGTSRSGATITGALLIGVSRAAAAEFTFYLAIPVMFGASLLKLVQFGLHFSKEEMIILMFGMFTAFFVSLLVVQFLMVYIKKHDFRVFGWYRIVLGIAVLVYFTAIRL